MAIESLGDIADVSLTTGAADPSQAQMLARVGHSAGAIESESSVSASIAQANARRQSEER